MPSPLRKTTTQLAEPGDQSRPIISSPDGVEPQAMSLSSVAVAAPRTSERPEKTGAGGRWGGGPDSGTPEAKPTSPACLSASAHSIQGQLSWSCR